MLKINVNDAFQKHFLHVYMRVCVCVCVCTVINGVVIFI